MSLVCIIFANRNHIDLFHMKIKEFALLCLLAVTMLPSCRHGDTGGDEAEALDTVPVLVTRMESCSRLYASEYRLRKILVYDNPAVISGSVLHQNFKVKLPIGSRRIAIPVTATAKAYVDMGKLTAKDVHRNGDKLEIVLPDPQVTLTSTRIDHDGVRQKVDLLRKRFTDEEITAIQRKGREDIVHSLAATNIIEDARASAARQLIPIAVQTGFKEENVTVTFRKDFRSEGMLQTIIKTID